MINDYLRDTDKPEDQNPRELDVSDNRSKKDRDSREMFPPKDGEWNMPMGN